MVCHTGIRNLGWNPSCTKCGTEAHIRHQPRFVRGQDLAVCIVCTTPTGRDRHDILICEPCRLQGGRQ